MLKSASIRVSYCLSHSTRIVESRNVKFLVNDLISKSGLVKNNHNEVQPSTSNDKMIFIHTLLVRKRIRQPVIRIPQVVGDRSSC